MSKIAQIFGDEQAFIGYITAGDPSIEKTEEFIIEMAQAGADAVELGIPFSDPIAEEELLQEASVRALENGCTTDRVFDMVEKVHQQTSIPVVLMAYLNTLYKYGYEKFCDRCKTAGIDGIIVPDMPYEERKELEPFTKKYGIDFITVVAPATKERIQSIVKESEGFIYAIPTQSDDDASEMVSGIDAMTKIIREVTDVPIAVNLEGKHPEDIEADGIIEESAIVELIAQHGDSGADAIRKYFAELR